jgi:hypothetical protein
MPGAVAGALSSAKPSCGELSLAATTLLASSAALALLENPSNEANSAGAIVAASVVFNGELSNVIRSTQYAMRTGSGTPRQKPEGRTQSCVQQQASLLSSYDARTRTLSQLDAVSVSSAGDVSTNHSYGPIAFKELILLVFVRELLARCQRSDGRECVKGAELPNPQHRCAGGRFIMRGLSDWPGHASRTLGQGPA